MDVAVDTACQWDGCRRKAARHAIFGSRVFDDDAKNEDAVTSRAKQHRDFCEKHVGELGKQYMKVDVLPLGECRTCSDASAAART